MGDGAKARNGGGLPADVEGAFVAFEVGEGDLGLGAGEDGGELLAPLDEDEGVGFGGDLVEAEGGEFALGFEPVEIEVEDVDPRGGVLVDEGEGGAGDVFRSGGVEGGGPSL